MTLNFRKPAVNIDVIGINLGHLLPPRVHNEDAPVAMVHHHIASGRRPPDLTQHVFAIGVDHRLFLTRVYVTFDPEQTSAEPLALVEEIVVTVDPDQVTLPGFQHGLIPQAVEGQPTLRLI